MLASGEAITRGMTCASYAHAFGVPTAAVSVEEETL